MCVADKAAAVLIDGGVIAYPTEGVFGLGCLPDRLDAVAQILQIKQRDASKGLILIAANSAQFDGWIQLPADRALPQPDRDHPVTWIVPASDRVDTLVRGDHSGIAVRITTNPIARAICETVDSPIISTSANRSGEPVAGSAGELFEQFSSLVDYVVAGECGPATGPSEIRHLESGAVLRPGS